MGTLLNRRRYMGGEKIIKNYLAFVAIEDGTFTPPKQMEYSLDGKTWTTLAANTASPTITAGNKIMWKATLAGGVSGIGKFSGSADYKVEGNLMSIYYGENFEDVTAASGKYGIGRALFNNETHLIDASNLVLSALTLNNNMYYEMFKGCSHLTAAPVLPAATLTQGCYQYMFQNCSSLGTAPSLPATTLAQNCYYGMFQGCSNLTTPPILSVTTLATACYGSMFRACSNLTTAPILPAETLVSNCYKEMFYQCSKLNYVKAMFTTTPGSSYTGNWLYGVASSGTFVKNSAATWSVTGTAGVPNNWTVETASS